MFHVEHNVKNETLIESFFKEGLDNLGIELDEEAISDLIRYFQLLLKKNEVINLISPKQDLKTKVAVHLLDSLTPLLWPDLPIEGPYLDFGSGGGLPAIPLSIILPGWDCTLIESTGKKASFLNEVKNEMKLENITLVNKFLEPGRNSENKFYKIATARAVSELKKLLAIVAPRLSSGGVFISFKGPQSDKELKDASADLKKYKMKLINRIDFCLPLVEAERSLLIFEKN